MFEEAEYGSAGSWDFENQCLHFAALLTPAKHRSGPGRSDLFKVVPSTAVAVPGQEIRGGWEGPMIGRHLFVSKRDVCAILDEEVDVAGFSTHAFTRQGQPQETDPIVQNLLQLISQDLSESSPAGPTFSEHLVGALVAHARPPRAKAYATRPRRAASGQRLAHRAASIIASQLGSKILLRDIAGELGVSVPYLCRVFKQSQGCSPHRYLVEQRVERAKWLLRQSECPLIEVAIASGFVDQSQFSKTFKKVVGTTPSKFRDG